MVDEKVKPILEDVAATLAEAEAQLPVARDLLRIVTDTGEDVAEVRALVLELETRIKQWTRVLKREGIQVPKTSGTTKA